MRRARPGRRAALLLAATLFGGPIVRATAAEGGFFSGAKPAGAGPASMADLEAAEAGLADLWTRTPFTARHVMFVTRKAAVYGDYEKRPTSVFGPQDKLVTYLEPVGYAWKGSEAQGYTFGITTDFEILNRGGKILGGQKAFQTADLSGHYRNREFFVTLTLSVTDIDPGDYVLAYTLHDHVGGRETRVEQPFTIRAGI